MSPAEVDGTPEPEICPRPLSPRAARRATAGYVSGRSYWIQQNECGRVVRTHWTTVKILILVFVRIFFCYLIFRCFILSACSAFIV